jgi:hypothetical protein
MLGSCCRSPNSIQRIVGNSAFEHNYRKPYIGMSSDGRSRHFVHLAPKKKFVRLRVSVRDLDAGMEHMSEAPSTHAA